jgi:uncharacterized membrane protein
LTDLIQRPPNLPQAAEKAERNTALVIYGLYLAAPFSVGITGLIGALMASGRRMRAGGLSRTHYRFQVWSFWAATGAAITGGFWGALGSMATVANRTGGDLVLAGGALAATAGVGFIASTLFGLSRIAGWEPIGHADEVV